MIKDIKFYPGHSKIMEKHYEVETYFFPPEHKINPQTENDWALLKLKEKILSESFIPLRHDIQKLKVNATFTITGYPSSKYHKIASLGGRSSVSQWGNAKIALAI